MVIFFLNFVFILFSKRHKLLAFSFKIVHENIVIIYQHIPETLIFFLFLNLDNLIFQS